jgi:hypothetical protein
MHWGPSLWAFIHIVTVNKEYRALEVVRSIGPVMPCQLCRYEYDKSISELDGSSDLFRWSVDFHNTVNVKLGKPKFTYEQALEKWTRII